MKNMTFWLKETKLSKKSKKEKLSKAHRIVENKIQSFYPGLQHCTYPHELASGLLSNISYHSCLCSLFSVPLSFSQSLYHLFPLSGNFLQMFTRLILLIFSELLRKDFPDYPFHSLSLHLPFFPIAFTCT